MWIPLFILVVGFAMFVGFAAGRVIASRQNLGEGLVANMINWGLQRPHLLLNNVTLQTGEGTTQIDHVLVADTGIFVIETKHYSGWIFGEPHGDRWTQVIYRKKSRFQNPIRQNFGHVKALQLLFKLPGRCLLVPGCLHRGRRIQDGLGANSNEAAATARVSWGRAAGVV